MQTSAADEAETRHSLVFFDLETTGFGPKCEIVQLAAVSGDSFLNLHVVPRCPVHPKATQVTGFSVVRQELYLHGRLVPTKSLREALASFIAFLQALPRPLLVGHNIRRFDCLPLARALEQTGLREQLEASISGCMDTLPLTREVLRECGMKSFRQEHLVRELLGADYQAHDALEDVRALQRLYHVVQPSPEVVARHLFSLSDIQVGCQLLPPVAACGTAAEQDNFMKIS
ncbi:maternal protein exuperantia-like [Nerophis ophidion]|uniref:maternal protein exuperantia-like n=1 Tax=Nerophis ophidion TaxID=159077 RepID=UPI002ADF263E|nr:maternal protein exuperantia-like [Nerophis ophidion]